MRASEVLVCPHEQEGLRQCGHFASIFSDFVWAYSMDDWTALKTFQYLKFIL